MNGSESLRERLDALGREANQKIRSINYGGCCVFASLVADRLAALGVEHEIVGNFDGHSVDEVRPQDNMNARMWPHCMVHLGLRVHLDDGEYLYDANGLRQDNVLSGWSVAKGSLTDEEARLLADDRKRWNRRFSREQIPKLRKLVEAHLS